MTEPLFIAGDWGTSNLRLLLCQGGQALVRLHGAGIAISDLPPQVVFRRLTAAWIAEFGPLPALLCGAVGSRGGWHQAPYLSCPTSLDALDGRLLEFNDAGCPIAIVPGLACSNPLGAPDVMRGEETLLLGALALRPELARGRRLFAMPGTHCKWIVVEDGRVATFLTAPVGELFALLRKHGTLSVAPGDYMHDDAGFALGLERAATHGNAGLPHLLFETRSRQLREGMTPAAAMSFLSGLLIGSDVGGARGWFGGVDEVVLIGTQTLTGLYAQALALHGISSLAFDGQQCAMAGLTRLFAEWRQREAVHVA